MEEENSEEYKKKSKIKNRIIVIEVLTIVMEIVLILYNLVEIASVPMYWY